LGVNQSEFRGLSVSNVKGGTGVLISDSHNNTFTEITSTNNGNGTYVRSCSNNSITLNNFDFNQKGIIVEYSPNNTISANSIYGNNNTGMHLALYSGHNRLYNNSFIANGQHAYLFFLPDRNYWNLTVGNYWDNYTERYPDATNNGTVWNTPFELSTSESDNLPLVYDPFFETRVPKLSITSADNTDGTKKVMLQWNRIASANNYLVYRANAEISSVQNLEPLASVSTTSYSDNVPEGTYYYVVIAVGGSMKSKISNNVNIEVHPPEDPENPDKPGQSDPNIGLIIGLVGAAVGIAAVAVVVVIKKRKAAGAKPTRQEEPKTNQPKN